METSGLNVQSITFLYPPYVFGPHSPSRPGAFSRSVRRVCQHSPKALLLKESPKDARSALHSRGCHFARDQLVLRPLTAAGKDRRSTHRHVPRNSVTGPIVRPRRCKISLKETGLYATLRIEQELRKSPCDASRDRFCQTLARPRQGAAVFQANVRVQGVTLGASQASGAPTKTANFNIQGRLFQTR